MAFCFRCARIEKMNYAVGRECLLWLEGSDLKNYKSEIANARGQTTARLLKDMYAARAKENLVTSTGGAAPQPLQNSVKAANTQKELAKVAKVSHDTIAKGRSSR